MYSTAVYSAKKNGTNECFNLGFICHRFANFSAVLNLKEPQPLPKSEVEIDPAEPAAKDPVQDTAQAKDRLTELIELDRKSLQQWSVASGPKVLFIIMNHDHHRELLKLIHNGDQNPKLNLKPVAFLSRVKSQESSRVKMMHHPAIGRQQ